MNAEFTMTEADARKIAERYQRGFDSRFLREAEMFCVQRPDAFYNRYRFRLGAEELEYYGEEIYGLRSSRVVNTHIILDLDSRRVWTDFVEGAGVSF